jgi:hypothetical protein
MKKLLIVLALLSQVAHAQIVTQITSQAKLSKMEIQKLDGLRVFNVLQLEPATLNRYVKKNPLQAKLKLAISKDLTLDLTIQQNEIRSVGYKALMTTDKGLVADSSTTICNTYSGYVNDDPNQFVRLYIDHNQIKGVISDGKEGYYAIEPLADITKMQDAENRHIVFNVSDVNTIDGKCGLEEPISQAVAKGQSAARTSATFTSACRILEVATDADYEYYKRNGAATNSRILNDMNIIAGIYQSTFNVRIMVTYQHVFTTADDPYTSTDPSKLLGEFTKYWNKNMTGVKRDVAHLFTSKVLDAFTLGIAHTGTIGKNPAMAYSLTYCTPNEYMTTAHEIGHNFNASHPTDAKSGCSTGSKTVMCSGLEKALVFSEFSQKEIKDFISANETNLLTSQYDFKILGDSTLCANTSTYRMNHLGPSVEWSSSDPTILTINENTGVAKRVGTESGNVTLTATIDVCGTSLTFSKNIYIGLPSLTTTIANVNSYGVVAINTTEVIYGTYNWHIDGKLIKSGLESEVSINGGTCGANHFIQATVTNACGTTPLSNQVSYSWTCTNTGANIYPNPARDVISVDFESESADKLLPKEILLYNEKSAIVRSVSGSNSFSAASSTKRTQMDVASLPRGTYYLYVIPEKDSGQKTEVKRILLE